MRNKMVRILMSKDKEMTKTHGGAGVLSRLLRRIFFDLGIGLQHWSSLLHEFVMDSRNGVPNTRKDQTSMRGNLTKEFAREQMTWKVFIKAMRFMKFPRIDITVRAYRDDGTYTDHTESVDFGNRRDINLFLEQLEQDETQEADGIYHQFLDDNPNAPRNESDKVEQAAAGYLPPELNLPPSPVAIIPTFKDINSRGYANIASQAAESSSGTDTAKKDFSSKFFSSNLFTPAYKQNKGESK